MDESAANTAAQEAKGIKDECEEKLAEAMPAMNAALTALDTLKQNDITIVKAMKNPPDGVKLVMEAVCIIKGLKPEKRNDPNGKIIEDYWPTAKKMLGDMKFLENLKSFDKDNIEESFMRKIRDRYLPNPDFDPAIIRNISSACEGLCLWVRAIEQYDKIIKIVAPKKASLQAAEAVYSVQMSALRIKQTELRSVQDKLDKLNNNLQRKQNDKTNLENNIQQTIVKIDRAEKLISGLGGERDRWSKNIVDLTNTYDNIIGDVLISAAVVAYLGPFVLSYRQECTTEWRKMCEDREIPVSSHFSLSDTLGEPVLTREWNIYGLPVDNFSLDNAIICLNANRWPLIIDPQGQANKWIKNMEKANKLEVIKLSDSYYTRQLENCLQFGTPCLIENVGEELDPILSGVLLKQTFKQSGVEYICLGDHIVEYTHDFRLYITTRLRNPHYLPEWSVKVTLVNFMITETGLQDQLLGIVTAKEKPELEERKNALILESAFNRKQLKELEDKILEVLSTSKGNILEDEVAINILSSSKTLSIEIFMKQEVASATENEIDEVRNGYFPFAQHGSFLFFTISELANLDPMYQYSLTWFLNLYLQSIINSQKSALLSERLRHLSNDFTNSIYQNVCRSLFEKDKLLFSFLLCVGIARGNNEIDDEEWRFLLTGGVALDNPYPNPAAQWLADKLWAEAVRASESLPSLHGFKQHLERNPDSWKILYDSSHPHRCLLPAPWQENLSGLSRLIVLRCIRPDKIIPAAIDFIIKRLGAKYVEPPPFDLYRSYADSTPVTPLIFVLSPGVDPMNSLLKFAEERALGFTTNSRLASRQASRLPSAVKRRPTGSALHYKNYQSDVEDGEIKHNDQVELAITTELQPLQEQPLEQTTVSQQTGIAEIGLDIVSLGQGQGPIAEKLILEAVISGRWVVLQNCHLSASWLPQLEHVCETVINETVNPNFRLWLTSYPSNKFPVSVLQNGVKMTNEPPKGLRANILRSYLNDPISDPDFFQTCKKPKVFEKLVFGLCIFHALVQERRKFGALGWNIPYQFDDSDMRISVKQLQMFIDEYDQPPLEALSYLTGECNYGGRVTDPHDRRLLLSLLDIFYCSEAIEAKVYDYSESKLYHTLDNGRYEDYLNYIRGLPLTQQPEVFGLHENADISKEKQETQQLFDGILLTLPRESSKGGKSSQQIIEELASDILGKLPVDFNLEMVQAKYPVMYEDSMNTVLIQELIRFNRLTGVLRKSLNDLLQALKGLVVMSQELDDVFDSMLVGKVPLLWAAKSYPSLKSLGSYIADLLTRLQFFQIWIKCGAPTVFWISGFYFTQSFLTGVLQNYARRHKIPVDLLAFEFLLLEEESFGNCKDDIKNQADGAIVRGLFLEGARWNAEEKCLVESHAKVLHESLPLMWLKPDHKSKVQPLNTYACPVYKTSARRGELSTTGHSTNYVLTVHLPINHNSEAHWINRGVALLCQLDD